MFLKYSLFPPAIVSKVAVVLAQLWAVRDVDENDLQHMWYDNYFLPRSP